MTDQSVKKKKRRRWQRNKYPTGFSFFMNLKYKIRSIKSNGIPTHILLLVLIILIGLIVRVWGINWGLPELYEEARPMYTAWKFWGWETGKVDLNPHTFGWPSFSFYVAFVTQVAYYIGGRAAGTFHSLSEFRSLFETNISSFVLIHRFVSVFIGLGAIFVTFLLGTKIFNRKVGLLSAFFLSLNLLHIQQSQRISPDILTTFLVLVSFLFIWNVYKKGRARDYVLAGFFIGLSIATKYIPVLLVIPLLSSHILRQKNLTFQKHANTRIILGCLFIGFGFFVGSPFNILDIGSFMIYLSEQKAHMTLAAHFGQEYRVAAWLFYLTHSLPRGLGLPLEILSLFGAILIVYTSWKNGLLLLIFPIIYFVIIGSWKTSFDHYILPIMPFLVFFSAYILKYFFDHISRSKMATSALFLSSIILIFPSCFNIYRYQKELNRQDTRTLAKNWIENNIPENSSIAIEFYSPQIEKSNYLIVNIPVDVIHPEVCEPFYNSHWYVHCDYIIISSLIYDRYLKNPDMFPVQKAFYNNLENNYDMIQHFDSKDKAGPTLKIYKLRTKTLSLENSHVESLYRNASQISNKKMLSSFLVDIANIWQSEGLYDGAANLLEKAASLNPNDAYTHYSAGNMYLDSNFYDQAINEFKRAIVLAPKVADFHVGLGIAYYMKGLENKALSEWGEAIKINPINAVAHFNIGNKFWLEGKVNQAISHYQKAIKAEPNLTAALKALATAYHYKGMRKEAVTLLKKVVQATPNDAQAYQNLGILHIESKQYQDAISYLQESVRIEPSEVEAHIALGTALTMKGLSERGIEAFQDALKLSPNSASAHQNLAIAFFYKKEYELSWRHMEIAESLGVSPPEDLIKALKEIINE